LFYSRTSDGTTFVPRVQIPTEGTPRHVQVAAEPDASLVVVWDEAKSGARRAVAARVTFDAKGSPVFSRQVLGDGVYPTIAMSQTAVVAWSATGTIHVDALSR